MRPLNLLIFLLATPLLALPARGDDRRDLVLAARQAALDELLHTVLTMPLETRLTVGDVAESAQADLDTLMTNAEQIGGPRWIEPQAVQVRMELSGQHVREWLTSAVRDSNRSAIPRTRLTALLADYDTRRFAAEGLAVLPAVVSRAMVDRLGPLAARSPEDRDALIRDAVHDAAQRALARINDVALPGNRSVGAMLATDPARAPKLLQWLAARPIIAARVPSADELIITLHVAPDSLAGVLQSIAGNPPGNWDAVPDALVDRLLVIDGRARLAPAAAPNALSPIAPAPNPPTPDAPSPDPSSDPNHTAAPGPAPSDAEPARAPPPALPARPPEWATRLVRAEGTAPSAGDRLRTARAAEQVALQNLHGVVLDLPLDAPHTVRNLAAVAPAIDPSLRRALSRATVSRITHLADGGATVEIVLDGRHIWQALLDTAR
jgi:hypothetical protein